MNGTSASKGPFTLSYHGQRRLQSRGGLSPATFHEITFHHAYLYLGMETRRRKGNQRRDIPARYILVWSPKAKRCVKVVVSQCGVVITALPKCHTGTAAECSTAKDLYLRYVRNRVTPMLSLCSGI